MIEIRPITAEDVAGFHACLDAVSRERKYLGHVSAPTIKATRRWVEGGIERGDIRLVATENSRIVGWCDVEVQSHEGFEHSGKLGTGVLMGYRGQGIGTQLVERALHEARNQGLERVELEVYASNARAIHLYQKFDFRVEGQKRRARKLNGEYDDILIMAILFNA
jgi:RimJ/RimL family protein N-acetyltransferase